MIQLVSPTDFSDVSENALKYAIGLQRVFGEELAIVHFYQRVRATGHFISMRDILQEDSEREMQQLVKSLEGSLPEKKQIRLKVAEGEVPEMLRGMVKGDRLHLIVMGSNGASKIKNIFGSTAKAVINQVLTPTLIIPPGCEYKKYEHMVVANDGMMTDENLKFVALFANSFDAHIYFLHVGDLDLSKDLVDRYAQSLGNCRFSFHNIGGSDILTGIDEFSGEVDADLVVMAKKKRNFLQKIFTTSQTDRELFHAQKPLLILHRDE